WKKRIVSFARTAMIAAVVRIVSVPHNSSDVRTVAAQALRARFVRARPAVAMICVGSSASVLIQKRRTQDSRNESGAARRGDTPRMLQNDLRGGRGGGGGGESGFFTFPRGAGP